MCVRGLCKLVFLHLRVECSWLGHLNLAACTTPHHARLHNQPKNFQPFCSCGQISHKSNNSWGSCRDMVSLGFRDGGVWITVGDYPFLYPHPSLFLCLSLSIHPSPQISSSRGSARSPSGHITDIWTATGELTGDSADERVEEKQKEETNRNIGALTPKVIFFS